MFHLRRCYRNHAMKISFYETPERNSVQRLNKYLKKLDNFTHIIGSTSNQTIALRPSTKHLAGWHRATARWFPTIGSEIFRVKRLAIKKNQSLYTKNIFISNILIMPCMYINSLQLLLLTYRSNAYCQPLDLLLMLLTFRLLLINVNITLNNVLLIFRLLTKWQGVGCRFILLFACTYVMSAVGGIYPKPNDLELNALTLSYPQVLNTLSFFKQNEDIRTIENKFKTFLIHKVRFVHLRHISSTGHRTKCLTTQSSTLCR